MRETEAPTEKPRLYGCHQCGIDYTHEPLTVSKGGIPARTFFFCTFRCRDNYNAREPQEGKTP